MRKGPRGWEARGQGFRTMSLTERPSLLYCLPPAVHARGSRVPSAPSQSEGLWADQGPVRWPGSPPSTHFLVDWGAGSGRGEGPRVERVRMDSGPPPTPPAAALCGRGPRSRHGSLQDAAPGRCPRPQASSAEACRAGPCHGLSSGATSKSLGSTPGLDKEGG